MSVVFGGQHEQLLQINSQTEFNCPGVIELSIKKSVIISNCVWGAYQLMLTPLKCTTKTLVLVFVKAVYIDITAQAVCGCVTYCIYMTL